MRCCWRGHGLNPFVSQVGFFGQEMARPVQGVPLGLNPFVSQVGFFSSQPCSGAHSAGAPVSIPS